MKKIFHLLALSLAALLCQSAVAQDHKIDHVEPPFWWAGMQNRALQLMVHGPNIAEMEPSLSYSGVRLQSVKRVANKNYVFLNLQIEVSAVPGKIDIEFKHGGELLTTSYELRARERNSARRKGYSSADVVLNLVPDRFANGDPGNDNMDGLADKVKRADKDGRHGGDIKGIADHLDYIAGLGFTAIWPTPLLENAQDNYSYHGYAITDFYRVDPRFGSNADYVALTAKARTLGLGTLHDIVLNHIGSGHWWMRDMPMPDWLNGQKPGAQNRHLHLSVQDPYAAQADIDNFTDSWFVPEMPDLNQRNPYLSTYLIQNTIWWVEYADLVGLRVDTYGYSDRTFLTEWSRRVTAEYPALNLVGEEMNNSPNVVSHWLRGKKNFDNYVSYMPGMMDFPLHTALRSALVNREGDIGNPNGLSTLYDMVTMDYLYPDPSKMMLFDGNHDVPRLFSVLGEDVGLNKLALAFIMTMPRVPQLYYGSEILLTSPTTRDDGATRQDFPGGWAGDKVNAFTGVGLSAAQRDMQAYTRALLNWRKTQGVIHSGKLMHFAPENGTYVYFRYDRTKKIMVILNKNGSDTTLALGRFNEMLRGWVTGFDPLSGKKHALAKELIVPARSALILELMH
jgi:glycosidase